MIFLPNLLAHQHIVFKCEIVESAGLKCFWLAVITLTFIFFIFCVKLEIDVDIPTYV